MHSESQTCPKAERHPPHPAPRTPHRVWALLGQRGGDNTQVRALANALAALPGWQVDFKTTRHNPLYAVPNILLGPTCLSLNTSRSDSLAPPWPDLVLTVGQRNVPVARWIQQHADRDVKLVTLGRPRAPLAWFDLVITTPQYHAPERPNVVKIHRAFHDLDRPALEEAGRIWQPRLAHLPRPYIAVLVGGDAPPYYFDGPAAQRLGRAASRLAAELGGSLLVTTGFRTGEAATEALFGAIEAPAYLYRFAPGDSNNPYRGFLALADRLIVTCESVSMLSEACATGRPVHIFDIPRRSRLMRNAVMALWRTACEGRTRTPPTVLSRLMDGLTDLGLFTPPRDYALFHQTLIDSREAVWLGQPDPDTRPSDTQDLARVVDRIRTLMDEAPGAGGKQPRSR